MDPQAIASSSQALVAFFALSAGAIGTPQAIKTWRRGFRLRGLFVATLAIAVLLAAIRISVPFLFLAATDALHP